MVKSAALRTLALTHVTSFTTDLSHSWLTDRDAVKLEGREACTCRGTLAGSGEEREESHKGWRGIKSSVDTARESKRQRHSRDRVSSAAKQTFNHLMRFALNIFRPLLSRLPHVQAWRCYQAGLISALALIHRGKKATGWGRASSRRNTDPGTHSLSPKRNSDRQALFTSIYPDK